MQNNVSHYFWIGADWRDFARQKQTISIYRAPGAQLYQAAKEIYTTPVAIKNAQIMTSSWSRA
eukprot:scaffold46181_cov96-Attheya_sp.AAC.1